MKLRIGHLSTFYHTAVLLMAEGRTAERLGVDVEWRLMGTGPAIVQAFERGELDLAYIGLPPAMIGMDRGVPIVCVAGGHLEGTVMAGREEWKGFSEGNDLGAVFRQFIGRKIGVPARGSIHDVIVRHAIEGCGLEREIQVLNYSWADMITEAVATNAVAAACGTPALAAAIRRFAGGKVLVPPSHLWPGNPSYGIVALQDLLEKRSDVVEAFLRLHEEATGSVRMAPRAAAKRIAAFVGIVDEDLVLDALAISPKYCAQLTEEYLDSTMRFVPVLQTLGYIRSEIARDRIFFRRIIDKVHPEKDHYGDGIESEEFGVRSAE